MTTRELLHLCALPATDVERALVALEDEGLIVRRPDKIVVEFAPVQHYAQEGLLRYDFRD